MLRKQNGTGLDFDKLYGLLSALKLVTSPLMVVLQIIPSLQTSLASLDRIQKFLVLGSVDAYELPNTDATPVSESFELHPIQRGRSYAPEVSTKDATFGVDDQPLLFNITSEFQSGSFTMIIGKVGSGKSTFLRSLAGETKLLSGTFTPSATGQAFCDQAVWLRNATIQQNIIAEDEYDEAWYNRVLSACGLVQDLNEMKRGDQTSIGSQGISLSGGQKDRLALARALYARKKVLVIDDMLAGLDNTTEKLVFDRVFGPNGLLRKSNATVIFATHATYYARYADRILVFSNGRISKEGSFQELVDRGVDFQANKASAINENTELISADEIVANVESLTKSDQLRVILAENEEEEEDAARRSGDKQSLMFFLKLLGRCMSHYTGDC
jgi:ATP-binding cassette subfamily C (CFTR/MRP) protein 1